MTIPVPHIDAPLIVTWLLAFFILLALGVAVRPELRDGKKLSRIVSYAIGLGVFIAALLALETYRGIACNCWAVQVPQLWIDAFAILTACTLSPPATFPRRWNVSIGRSKAAPGLRTSA